MKFVSHAKIRKEKFGTVVFDTLNEKVYVTDEIGAQVLSLLEEGRSVGDISTVMCDGYDAASAAITADVASFVNDLRVKKLITD